MRVFRDRHGRGVRGPVLPTDTPRWKSRSRAFDAAVIEAYAPLQQLYPAELQALDLAVDTVPRMRLRPDMTVLPDDIVADGPVPLGRVITAGVDARGNPTRARIVLFRMPIERRAKTTEERQELLYQILATLVAYFLNIDPTDIDPRLSW